MNIINKIAYFSAFIINFSLLSVAPLGVKIGNVTLHVVQADLLSMPVDAIVDPANTQLDPVGGVSKLINNKWNLARKGLGEANRLLLAHAKTVTNLPFGSSIKYVIHAVGPDFNANTRWHVPFSNPQEGLSKLEDTYYNALETAAKLKVTTIAFPIISGEIFKGDQSEKNIAEAAISGIQRWIKHNGLTSSITDIYLVTYAPFGHVSDYFTYLQNNKLFNQKIFYKQRVKSNNWELPEVYEEKSIFTPRVPQKSLLQRHYKKSIASGLVTSIFIGLAVIGACVE